MNNNFRRVKQFVFPMGFLILAGCVNPYKANFNSTRDRFPNWFEGRLAPKSTQPRLIETNDISKQNWDLFEDGYVMIGFSKFAGPEEDKSLAVAEAKSQGADVVVLQKKFAKTLTETVTVTQWPADETTNVHEETNVYGRKGVQRIETDTEVRTQRGPETSYVPQQVDYYEHSTTFWRKLERPVFGAFVQDLSDDLKQKLETNHGLVVKAVAKDSPAHTADLLKGDVILKVNGEQAPSAQKFYEGLASQAGKPITLSLLRNNKSFDLQVRLNP